MELQYYYIAAIWELSGKPMMRGKKVWKENHLDIGRVKTYGGSFEKNFILFRFQGNDEMKMGLYYNRFHGIIRQRKDVIRNRDRLDWQVVIQRFMGMFLIRWENRPI